MISIVQIFKLHTSLANLNRDLSTYISARETEGFTVQQVETRATTVDNRVGSDSADLFITVWMTREEPIRLPGERL